MGKPMPEEKWRSLVAHLRVTCPVTRRLVVHRVPMLKNHGTTSLPESEKTITISVNSTDDETVQRDSLVHEWAHAMEFDKTGNHGPVWGKFSSQTYSAGVAWDGQQ